MNNVQITSEGIKKALKPYKPFDAINEYIWNGFDAKADTVEIRCLINKFDNIQYLEIKDNGYGISKNELNKKFTPLFESQKSLESSIHNRLSAVHGKNGVGRLTFFKFSNLALWETVYHDNGENKKYSISIKSDNLATYNSDVPVQLTEESCGTKVGFQDIIVCADVVTLKNQIVTEFGWFLHLNRIKKYKILVNDEELRFDELISEYEKLECIQIKNYKFEVEYIRWNIKPSNEYSYFYFINSCDSEVNKETTKFNNKGDSFYHSMYIKSDYFDEFYSSNKNIDEGQGSLFDKNKHDVIYQELKVKLNEYLKIKRKPFLKECSKNLIKTYERENVLPKFNPENKWDMLQKQELTNLIGELFQAEPRIFTNLNLPQKKTLSHLLNLIMDSGERDKLFIILNEITELEFQERQELADILTKSSLTCVIKTIKLIEDRVKAMNQLQELVFNLELNANERDDIQSFIESHYWMFGEQYSLAAAAEDKFEKVLKKYTNILTQKDEFDKIEHPSRNKEMDILMVRQNIYTDSISNIVVELKAPWIKLGKHQLDQVIEYMDVITSVPKFNDRNAEWTFILVGNELNKSKWIDRYLENAKQHGKKSLVFKAENYEIYVKTWSEIINEFEIRHKFLLEKLEVKRMELYEINKSAAEIACDKSNSSAAGFK